MRSRISGLYQYPKIAGISFAKSGKTKQSFASECDVNRVMARYRKTGVLGNPLDTRRPYFGDFSSVSGYQESLEFVRGAERAFLALPTDLRMRFGNDVAALLRFVADPVNAKECIELGLLPKPPLDNSDRRATIDKPAAGAPTEPPKPPAKADQLTT